MSTEKKYTSNNLEFWGGIECTINRVNNSYFDQLHYSGHYSRQGDIKLISDLGIKTLRYPILWEKHEPHYQQAIDWTFTAQRLEELKQNDITPIAGLLHHGSGPGYTSLLDDNFPELFASYAGKVAIQFPWIKYYTPINEPLTTARFSGLYGLWYPHICNDVTFAKILLNQVKGIVLAIREIRKVNPDAMLVQTEDLSKTYSSPSLKHQAFFENERRWVTYDLLCGKLKPGDTMWNYFLRLGIGEEALNFFIENKTPPDIMGFNYYITSERYLDEEVQKYPAHTHGGNEIQQYADVEAIRISHENPSGLEVLLEEAWKRFELPIAITEAHINAGREDQLRWLNEIVNSCHAVRERGINIIAVTFWSLFGAYGWNKLLTNEQMEYESGAYDLCEAQPRPTAVAAFIKAVTSQKKYDHTLLAQKGWWHQRNRFYKAETPGDDPKNVKRCRPILILGKSGAFIKALRKICDNRNLPYVVASEEEYDLNDEKVILAFVDAFMPWAVINATGFVQVDHSPNNPTEHRYLGTNSLVQLATLCKDRNISFASFSCKNESKKLEDNFYFRNTLQRFLNHSIEPTFIAEKRILAKNSNALLITTSSLFSPFEKENFVIDILNSLCNNETVVAHEHIPISPTYVPHLIWAVLDLLIDGEKGIRPLANQKAISLKDFAQKIAIKAGYSSDRIIQAPLHGLGFSAPESHITNIQDRGVLPPLDEALNCFFNECNNLPLPVLHP